jgi:hypothetical protein
LRFTRTLVQPCELSRQPIAKSAQAPTSSLLVFEQPAQCLQLRPRPQAWPVKLRVIEVIERMRFIADEKSERQTLVRIGDLATTCRTATIVRRGALLRLPVSPKGFTRSRMTQETLSVQRGVAEHPERIDLVEDEGGELDDRLGALHGLAADRTLHPRYERRHLRCRPGRGRHATSEKGLTRVDVTRRGRAGGHARGREDDPSRYDGNDPTSLPESGLSLGAHPAAPAWQFAGQGR